MGVIATPGQNTEYGDEKVRGGELGFKSRLFDRHVAFDAAFYHYVYTGLQVGTIETAAATGVPQARTVNAGKSTVTGVEWAVTWRPEQVEGLTLNLNGNWDHGKFNTLNNIPCNPGQSISEGCNQQFSPVDGLFHAQDLSGTPLPDGPDWQVNAGFDYEHPLSDRFTVVFAEYNSYVSKFLTVPGLRADFYQKGYFKADASVALRTNDNRWEFALIGKNITNKITTANCSAANTANGAILGGDLTGAPGHGPAGIGELLCRVENGREVWLRATYKPIG
jgi:iron complex outermembrane receptor protein